MKPHILTNPIRIHHPHCFPSVSLFHFPSLSGEKPRPHSFPYPKSPQNPKAPNFASIKPYSTASSVSFGGWDDLGLNDVSVQSAESAQLRKFLVSIGIDDEKHVFMFVLGIVCALAVSRIRVSSFVVFPASVLIFGIGFSIGYFRGGGIGTDWSGNKKRIKEEISRVYGEKLREFLEFFVEFDGRVNDLKNEMRKGIDCDSLALSDLDNYVKEMESISSLVRDTRETVKASIVNVEDCNGVSVEDQRRNKTKRENGGVGLGFKLLEFFGGLFGQNSGGLKAKNVKENVKQEIIEGGVSGDRVSSHARRDKSVPHSVQGGKGDYFDFDSFQDIQNKQAHRPEGYRRILRNGSSRLNDFDESSTRRFADKKMFSYLDSRGQFVNSREAYSKNNHEYEQRTWESHSHGNSPDLVDFSVSMEHVETKSSFVKEQMQRSSSEIHGYYRDSDPIDDETYQSHMREEKVNSRGDFFSSSPDSEAKEATGSPFSSSVSNDLLFDRCLTDSNNLLKEAKELVRGTRKEEHAEAILYKSAKLLSQAIAMKPMSLLAVGQLGNTYLLHGELKLKISRDLRSLLLATDPFYIEKKRRVSSSSYYSGSSKDEIASVLVDVCEECEQMLLEAGRKYRLALSIDANDIRALYNWGLALSYRAQLIADIGPEAAFDADKVFLAAIDKFDAMMSKGNVYAPDALLRWGMTLQQRSRLRPSNSKEKMQLLQQAKRLYEDALHMDNDNPRVRDALSSCIFELNYRKF